MTQKRYTEIPKRQKCINKEEPYIGGAKDIIDDELNKPQSQINDETNQRVSTLEESVGTGGSVDERIAVEKNRAEQAEGVLDGKVATEKQRAEGVEGGLNTRLQTVEQLAEISVGGGDIGIGTAADFESDDPSDLAKVPTISAMLGGANDGVYDISARHSGTKYVDLAAALGTDGINVPVGVRKGGMSVKYVRTYDNKYVQYRCMAQNFTTDVTQWQILEQIEGNYYKKGYYLDSNGAEVANESSAVTDFIELVGGQEYTFISGFNTLLLKNIAKVVTYWSDKLKQDYYSLDSNGNVTFTLYSSAKYVRLSYNSTFGVDAKLMQGDTIVWEKKDDYLEEVTKIPTIVERIGTCENDIDFLDEKVSGNVTMYKKFLSDYSIVDSDNTAISDFIPISSYSLSHTINAYTQVTCYAVAYNANKEPITYYSIINGTRTGSFDYGTKFIRITCGIGKEVPNVIANNTTIWTRKLPLVVDDGTISDVENEIFGNIVQKGVYFNTDGSISQNADWGISDYFALPAYNHSYTFYAETVNSIVPYLITYTSGKAYKNYFSAGTRPSGFDYGSAYGRISCNLKSLKNAYLYDNTTGKYVWIRTNSISDNYDNLSGNILNLNDLAAYRMLSDNIEDAIKAYRNRVCRLIDNHALTFGFVTDVHLTSDGGNQHLRRLYTMAKYAKSSPCKFQLFGGDMVSGENTIALDMETMLNGKEAFMDNLGLPAFIVRGNHDGGHKTWKSIVDGGGHPTQEQTINNMDWYNMMVSSLDNVVMDKNNPSGGYYYKDFENEKIRLIVLNCYDMSGTNLDGNAYNAMWSASALWQKQIDWLVDVALNFIEKGNDKTNWGVIVASHDGVIADNYPYGNGAKVELILQAFKNGGQYDYSYSYQSDPNYYSAKSVDFRSQGAMNYIAYIHGHTHTDRVIFDENVPIISTGASHPDDTENVPAGATLALPRVNRELSEYLWDTIAIGDNEIDIYRFGAGHNRFVHLGGNSIAIGESITLTAQKLSGTLTWGAFSNSPGYYTPIVNGVIGTPVGTLLQKATVVDGVVTGISAGSATIYAEDENGNMEFFGIVVS